MDQNKIACNNDQLQMKDGWLSLCTYDHYNNGLGTVITRSSIEVSHSNYINLLYV
jgi:hypothetical protein